MSFIADIIGDTLAEVSDEQPAPREVHSATIDHRGWCRDLLTVEAVEYYTQSVH